MRIFHINCNYIGTTLHQIMIEQLNACGSDNTVYVPTYDKNRAVIEVMPYVCVSECFRKWDRIVFDYKQAKIMKDVLVRYDISAFDCIHAYTLFTDGNTAMRLSDRYGIPYVVAVRNTDVNVFFKTMVYLRKRGVQIMRKASAVFFLSEAYREQVLGRYVPEKYRTEIREKSEVIPNGIDDFWLKHQPDMIRNMPSGHKTVRLIYAGRIDKNKNIVTTQKAVDILREHGYEASLTVVGRIDDQAEFARIREHGFTSYVNAVPKEKLIELYRSHDIFVMPSFHETFGLVYAEALSQGLPVIYSKGQGFDGQFDEGYVGYAVSSRSADEIAQAIERIIKNYSVIRSNTAGAAAKFDWTKICRRYSTIYHTINH